MVWSYSTAVWLYLGSEVPDKTWNIFLQKRPRSGQWIKKNKKNTHSTKKTAVYHTHQPWGKTNNAEGYVYYSVCSVSMSPFDRSPVHVDRSACLISELKSSIDWKFVINGVVGVVLGWKAAENASIVTEWTQIHAPRSPQKWSTHEAGDQWRFVFVSRFFLFLW